MSQALVADATISNIPVAPNAKRLLFAGFMAILVAGVGFAIRGAILGDWATSFGFTDSDLGKIGGAGLTGFCFGIIIGGLLADKIGYGALIISAFLCHILSAVVSLIVPASASHDVAYQYLYWGSFIFAVANGTLEGVANPLVATLFPHNRTHYLNILHASWPAGLVIGALLSFILGHEMHLSWKMQLGLFMVPVFFYAMLFFGQKMPKSEAAEKGLSFADMFKDVGILGAAVGCLFLAFFFSGIIASLIPSAQTAQIIGYCIGGALLIAVAIMTNFSIGSWLLFVLFIAHALIGAVELGTDSWIQKIANTLFGEGKGNWLFIYASCLMFSLRFCANFIEKKLGLSPIGILLCASIIACIGLNFLSTIQSFAVAFVAMTVYALGKTFFWPTMLAVASDRFPRTGAIAISIMGGIAMLSAGLIGGPGLGYANDRFSGQVLATNTVVAKEYKAAQPSTFLGAGMTYGLDAKKLAAATAVEPAMRTPAEQAAVEAYQNGNRKTLRADSAIPAAMAVIYLCLFIYFKSIGGYRAVHLAGTHGAEGMAEPVPAH
jgi:MFS family permease